MREHIFRKMICKGKKHPSKIYGRFQLQILLFATAKAFTKRGRWILFSKDPLEAYACFTLACMKAPADQKKLFQVSYHLGKIIKRVTGFQEIEDLKSLVFFLYQNIGITMDGEIPGDICASECFFSRLYSAEQCRLISAMDRGIITGICGGSLLEFTQRITEGCEHCMATVSDKNRSSNMKKKKTAIVIGTGAGGETIVSRNARC